MRRMRETIYTVLGCLFLGLGAIGAALPVLPTVPFLLLAAACFMRGSRRLYRWLMTHPRWGEHVYQYREAHAITRRSKVSAITLLWCGIVVSVWLIPLWPVKALLVVIAACVTVYLARFDELDPSDLHRAKTTYSDFIYREFSIR